MKDVICTEITNTLYALQQCGLLYTHNQVKVTNMGTTTILSNPGHIAGAKENKPEYFGKIEQYCHFASAGNFMAMLFDGSLVLTRYEINRDELTGHNLWFWPYPVSIDSDVLLEYPPVDLLLSVREELYDTINMRSVVRFDYDLENVSADHSAAHLHFNHYRCRMPVARPMSFNRFIKVIFKNFYPEKWEEEDIFNYITINTDLENHCLDPSHIYDVHLGWYLEI